MPFIYTPIAGIREYTIIEKTESGKFAVKYGEDKAKCLSQIENISNSPEEAIADYYISKVKELSEKKEHLLQELTKLEYQINNIQQDEDYKNSKELFPEKFF